MRNQSWIHGGRSWLSTLPLVAVLMPFLGAPLSFAISTPPEKPGILILALKYVAYRDEAGKPILGKREAENVIQDVNRVYASCSIQFRLEEFVEADPKQGGLDFHPSRMKELDVIRSHYDDAKRLVVVNTGKWNHAGGLGQDGANAWTMMPGDHPAGTVLEGTFSKNSNLVAHELGHYLNLDHFPGRGNLMNPVIYRDSTALDSSQCLKLRQAAYSARAYAIRPSSSVLVKRESTPEGRALAGAAEAPHSR